MKTHNTNMKAHSANMKPINRKAMFLTAMLVQYTILGIMFYFMNHVESIKECGCNYEEWHQKYLKYYALLMITVVTLKPIMNKHIYHKNSMGIGSLVDIIIMTSIIVMFYALFKFTRKLNEEACKCLVEGKEELYTLLYIYSYVPFLYIVSFIIMVIYLILDKLV